MIHLNLEVIAEAAKAAGTDVKLKGYLRMQLGEGIEKGGGGDFAGEVAKLAGN